MRKNELTLNHLSAYLPHKVTYLATVSLGMYSHRLPITLTKESIAHFNIKEGHKLQLKPMRLLNIKDLEENLAMDYEEAEAVKKDCPKWINGIRATVAAKEYLLRQHFDIFGLIDKGLAIEKE